MARRYSSPPENEKGGRMMARLLRAMARLDAHWAGDLIGSICLFAMLYVGLLLGYGMGLK